MERIGHLIVASAITLFFGVISASSSLPAWAGTTATVGWNKGSFNVGTTLTLQVKDADLNTNSSTQQTIVVPVTNTSTLEVENLLLTETTGNSGIFVAQLPTAFGNAAGVNDSGSMNVQNEQHLAAKYFDAETLGQPFNHIELTVAQGGTDGTVLFGPDPFRIGFGLVVQVSDADRNTSPGNPQSVTVAVSNGVTGETETVTLNETGNDSGVFEGGLSTRFGNNAGTSNDGSINVLNGQIVTLAYSDTLTISGTSSASRAANATAQGGTDAGFAMDPATLYAGTNLTLQVFDPDRNTDPGSAETVTATVVNIATSESETVTLTETGANTGAFVGALPTAFGNAAGINNDGSLNVKNNQQLSGTYFDALTASGLGGNIFDDVFTRGGTDAAISISPAPFTTGEAITVQVNDADRNAGAASVESVTVTVTNAATGETENVSLTETGANSGIFTGTLSTGLGSAANPSIGLINAKGGDLLTASYADNLSSAPGSQTRTASTVAASTRSFSISQMVDISNLTMPGLLKYEIAIANTGNVTLTGTTLTDNLKQSGGALALTSGPTLEGDDGNGLLDIGETWLYKATYQVTQANIDNGADIVNSASFGADDVDAKSASAVTTVTQASAFTVAKDVDEATYDAVGDVLHYKITIANTGGVTLTGITLNDALTDDEACPATMLAPSASMQCTASYAVTQADLDTGEVVNTASIDTDQTDALTDGATSSADQSSALSVSKTSASHFSKAGDTLDYNFIVTNSGNTTLTNVTLTDPLISNTAIPGCDYQELPPGAEMTCSGQYVVTQADVDAGEVTNVATAKGAGPGGEVTGSDTITIAITTGPSDAEVRKNFKNLTGSFMAHRIDRILESDPDLFSLEYRLGGGQQQAGLIANLQGVGNAIDGTFSMSVQGMRAKMLQLAGDGLPEPGERNWLDRVDIWVEGKFSTFADPGNGNKIDGQFGIVHTGADYRISDDVLLGFLASIDWANERTDEVNGEVKGDGWMIGPYVSARLSENLFFDARAAWGRSDNNAKQTIMGVDYEGDFKTERLLARATLSGAFEVDAIMLSPEVSIAYIEEKQDSYEVGNGVSAVSVDGQKISVGRMTLGQEIAYRVDLELTQLLPYLRANMHWDFMQAESFTLVDDSEALEEIRAGGEFGIRVQSDAGIFGNLAVTYDGLFSNQLEAFGVRGGIAVQF